MKGSMLFQHLGSLKIMLILEGGGMINIQGRELYLGDLN